MQLILTASDLAAMPGLLRQQLLEYVATRRKAMKPSAPRRPREAAESPPSEGLAVLDRAQAVSLLRNVSFGRGAKSVHDLLEALAYDRDVNAPEPADLVRLLKLNDRRDLRRHFAAIRRLLRQMTHDAAPVTRYSRSRAAYIVHPATRASLREVFGELVRPEAGEEPPWA